MFIIYLVECKRREQRPVSHLQFRIKLYEALLQNWEPQGHSACPLSRSYCNPIFTELQKPCIVCNGPGMLPVVRPKTYCARCNKYMCFKKDCYKQYHDSLS
jgi:hypothetical protein